MGIKYTGSKFKNFKNRQKIFLLCGLYGMICSALCSLIFLIISKFVFQNKSAIINVLYGVVVSVCVIVFIISVFCVWYGVKQYKKEYYFRRLNNKVVCKSCGDEISQNEKYCDNCGIIITEGSVEKGTVESEPCNECGKLNYKNKSYCKHCGEKIKKVRKKTTNYKKKENDKL